MPDAHDDREAEDEVAVALSEPIVVDEPQPDGVRHDREREDRVREVVQRPRDDDARPTRRCQPSQPREQSHRTFLPRAF